MPLTELLDRPLHPNRILADLAESRLDDDEANALTLWIEASVPNEVPEGLIARGLRARAPLAKAV
jgi:hypothetical protein